MAVHSTRTVIGAVGPPLPEAFEHGFDDVVERQALLDVQLRCEPHLGVHNTVGGEVFGALAATAEAPRASA